MMTISSVGWRRIVNSRVGFTTEFEIRLAEGSVGLGASPLGETISVYEDKGTPISPAVIVERLQKDAIVGKALRQESFDAYLAEHMPFFGRNNCYALSLAFFNACRAACASNTDSRREETAMPRICCNILNGGNHAYTNPVLSDFTEYLLVARDPDIESLIVAHNEIQSAVKEGLRRRETVVVGGNTVARFATADNRECIEFLLNIRDRLGYSEHFDLMIDASAGDLWGEGVYRLAVTGDIAMSPATFTEYWLGLLGEYPIRFLEDPFAEHDTDAWIMLTGSQATCFIVGDNFYSSDAERIARGAENLCTHGVIVKPNQAGSVTAASRAIEVATRTGQIPIVSHRSISTECPFESTLACMHGVDYIKIGPLATDYSSVVRLNELLRQTQRVSYVQ
jgi:enolase